MTLRDVLCDAATLSMVVPAVWVYPVDKRDCRLWCVKNTPDDSADAEFHFYPRGEDSRDDGSMLSFRFINILRDMPPKWFQGQCISFDDVGWYIDGASLDVAETYCKMILKTVRKYREKKNA